MLLQVSGGNAQEPSRACRAWFHGTLVWALVLKPGTMCIISRSALKWHHRRCSRQCPSGLPTPSKHFTESGCQSDWPREGPPDQHLIRGAH